MAVEKVMSQAALAFLIVGVTEHVKAAVAMPQYTACTPIKQTSHINPIRCHKK